MKNPNTGLVFIIIIVKHVSKLEFFFLMTGHGKDRLCHRVRPFTYKYIVPNIKAREISSFSATKWETC